jgi:hypothetical protein
MLDLYVEILKLTNDRNVEMLDRGKEFMDELTPEVVSKFFKSIVKDVRSCGSWGPFENEPEIQEHSLIEMIMAKGSNRLKGAINVSKHVLELSDKASKSWRWVASTETIHLKERV